MRCFQMRWTHQGMCLPESGKKWDALLGEELEGAFVFN